MQHSNVLTSQAICANDLAQSVLDGVGRAIAKARGLDAPRADEFRRMLSSRVMDAWRQGADKEALTQFIEYLIMSNEESWMPWSQLGESTPIAAYEADFRSDGRFQLLSTAARDMRLDFYERYMVAKLRAGLTTQAEVAKAAEINRSTVISIEKYKVLPRIETIRRLAKAFGVDPLVLIPRSLPADGPLK